MAVLMAVGLISGCGRESPSADDAVRELAKLVAVGIASVRIGDVQAEPLAGRFGFSSVFPRLRG